jgi:hypothetical protein
MRDAGCHAQLHLGGSLGRVHPRYWFRIAQKLLPHLQFIVAGVSGRELSWRAYSDILWLGYPSGRFTTQRDR